MVLRTGLVDENTDNWQQALNGASRLQGSARAFFRDTEDAVMKEHEETESEGEASDADVVMVTDDETRDELAKKKELLK